MKKIILGIIGCIVFSGTSEAMLAAAREAVTTGGRRVAAVRSVQTVACGSGVPWAEIPFTDTTDPEYQKKVSEHKALAELYSDPILAAGKLTVDTNALERIIESELGIKLSSDAKVYSWNAGKNITSEGGLDTAVVVSVQATKGPAVVLTTPYSIAMMKRGESDVYGRTSIEIAHSLTPGDVLYPSPVKTVIARTSDRVSVIDLAKILEGMAWCFERSPTVKGVIRMTVPSLQEFAIVQYLNKLGVPAALAEPERELSEAWRIEFIKSSL